MSIAVDGAAGLCRIQVRAPRSRFTLAVPVDVVIADLLPAVIDYAGENLDEESLDHGGWVLQRLGEDPLDDETTCAAAGMRDGEALFLRPRQEVLPPVHFDDLVDAVSTTLSQRPDGWRPAHTRRWLIGLALAAVVAGLLVLRAPGVLGVRTGLTWAGVTVLMAAAVAVARIGRDRTPAVLLSLAALLYSAQGAALLIRVFDGTPGQRALAALGAVIGTAGIGLALIWSTAHVAVLVLALPTAVGVVAAALGLPVPHAAALTLVVLVYSISSVPGLAFSFSGLRLPLLPANAEQLQEGIDPLPSKPVLSRSSLADTYLTAIYAAAGTVLAGGLTLLIGAGDPMALAEAAVVCALLLLHARGLGGLWPRLSVLLPGGYGLFLVAVRAGGDWSPAWRAGLVGALLLAGVGLAATAVTVPGRRLVPHWGRAADLAQLAASIALVPLTLWLLGVYQWSRGLSG